LLATDAFEKDRKHQDSDQYTFTPSLEQMQLLRNDPMAWDFVCRNLLPCVIGSNAHKEHIDKCVVSEFTTKSDIPFVLLMLENHWDNWKTGQKGFTKWTIGNIQGGRNMGYDQAAYKRFNQLCEMESIDRESDEGKATEIKFLKQKQFETALGKKKRKR
jgi:hypothetical protein